jgi:hypothetical protein
MFLERLRDKVLEALPAHRSRGLCPLEEVVGNLKGSLHGTSFPYLWVVVKGTSAVVAPVSVSRSGSDVRAALYHRDMRGLMGIPKRKVFISYHHGTDQWYADEIPAFLLRAA